MDKTQTNNNVRAKFRDGVSCTEIAPPKHTFTKLKNGMSFEIPITKSRYLADVNFKIVIMATATTNNVKKHSHTFFENGKNNFSNDVYAAPVGMAKSIYEYKYVIDHECFSARSVAGIRAPNVKFASPSITLIHT